MLDSGLLLVGPNVNITQSPGNQTEGTIVINPTNSQNLFASETFTNLSRYSEDGGLTWTNSNLSAIPSSGGDVQAAWDNFGNLFITRFGPGFSIIVARSSDGGATFKDPRTVVGPNSDQPSIAVGPSGVAGIPGSVWISVTNASNQIVAAGAPVMGFDSVGAFTAPQVAPGSSGDFGSTAIGPSGQVLVTWQNNGSGQGPDTIRVNLDADGLGPGGFGPIVIATTTNVGGLDFIPAQPSRSIDAEANLAWDRSNGPNRGRVYLVYTDETVNENNDTDIFVRFSDNNGATWSQRVRVNDDPGAPIRSQYNPAIAVDQTTGHLAVTWYDARNDEGVNALPYTDSIPNTEVQVFGSASLNGGLSFLANVQISTGVISGPAAGSFNLGDYDTMDFHAGAFYRIWADNSVGPGALSGNPGPGRTTDMATARVVVAIPAGPFVISSVPSGRIFGLVTSVRVTFDREIDISTFTIDDIVGLNGPLGPIAVTAVTVVPGSGGTQFDITFTPQRVVGTYTLVVGPDIRDLAGTPMDQDADQSPGEVPDDRFTTTFSIRGPRIVAVAPANNARLVPPVGSVRVTFDTPMDPLTFTPVDVALAGPGGPIAVIDVVAVAGTNDTQFDIRFATQAVVGTYTLVVGPDIRDRFYNPMDQDSDLVPGEVPDDQFRSTFGLLGPRIIASTPTTTFQPVGSVRVTFNVPIDVTTFTTADVALTGPGGPIPVTDVVVVAGTNDTQFDIRFATQAAVGTYTLVIGPDIRDRFGNAMDQDNDLIPGEVPDDQFRTTFTIRALVPYQASGFPFENINLEAGQPGVFTIIASADDTSVPLNLGTSTFNFYGVNYTGNNRLFVSSNGLITFGSGNADFSNSDLTTTPPQAAIAPLWDDWIKTSGSPMVVGRFDDLDGNGTFDRLIIEWNDVLGFPSSPSGVTFQAILGLNTGSSVPGDIVFNYPDLDSGDFRSNGASATVGIKDVTPPGPNRVLISFNSTNPLVGSGRALRLSVPPAVTGDEVPTAPQPLPPPPSDVRLGDLVDLAIAEDEAPEEAIQDDEGWLIHWRRRRPAEATLDKDPR